MSCFQFSVLHPSLSPDHWPLGQPMLLVREAGESPAFGGLLAVYDSCKIKRLQLSIDSGEGYQCRAGLELPRAGLRLVCVWGADGSPIELQPISIPIQ